MESCSEATRVLQLLQQQQQHGSQHQSQTVNVNNIINGKNPWIAEASTPMRQEAPKVICSLCDTEQDVQQNCVKCGVCMGNFFCQKCKFFDDDVSKKQYHCDKCGICRMGGEENFFHCDKCDVATRKRLKIHTFAWNGQCTMIVLFALRYYCPVCSKSICDLTEVRKKLDLEITNKMRKAHDKC